jgi:HSP20 family molecular chaperone IbpA
MHRKESIVMADERTRVAPEVCSYTDDEHTALTIEIQIPGVDKADIKLRMHDDSLSLTAPRTDFDYVATLAFCCPVDPDKTEASYENGLLRIQAPFRDPMEDARDITIG